MNDREKKLIMILLAAGFIIVNLFGFSTYSKALQNKKVAFKTGADELKMKKLQLEEAGKHLDEVEWLAEHLPAEGTHASVRGDLVTLVEQSAQKQRLVMKKRPTALRENQEEVGEFHTAVVKVVVNARDPELYRWLVELQNPEKMRAITRLRITPQRGDATRMDCELEITQWYTPIYEEDEEG